MKHGRFLWHLKCDGFNRGHWWKGSAGVSRLAAMWEVIRRHPNARAICDSSPPYPDELHWFIAEHTLKAWPQLRPADQRDWRSALALLPPQRGIDPRPVYSVTAQSIDTKNGAPAHAALAADERLRRRKDRLSRSILETAEQLREQEIARLAIEHHRAGRVLVAINPDTDFSGAAEALEVACSRYRKADHGRGRVADWLNVIKEFEESEAKRTAKQTTDKTLFLRYRNVISGTSW